MKVKHKKLIKKILGFILLFISLAAFIFFSEIFFRVLSTQLPSKTYSTISQRLEMNYDIKERKIREDGTVEVIVEVPQVEYVAAYRLTYFKLDEFNALTYISIQFLLLSIFMSLVLKVKRIKINLLQLFSFSLIISIISYLTLTPKIAETLFGKFILFDIDYFSLILIIHMPLIFILCLIAILYMFKKPKYQIK